MIYKLLAFNISILCFSCAYGGSDEEQILKEYFFYRCVNEGHKELDIGKYDGSLGYIVDSISSSYSTIEAISNFAKKTGEIIPTSNYTDKKNVLATCLSAYESDELEEMIKSAINSDYRSDL